MDAKTLMSLRARAQALEASLVEQKEMFERGQILAPDYQRMRTDFDRQRREILMGLKAAIAGADPRIDEVVQDAIDGTAEPAEAAKQLKKVAEEKGLGTKILEAIDKSRGTIITWAIDIALAIGKRVA